MKKALHPHEAFASFMIGVHSAYVLLVTQDGLTARPIQTNADDLTADITALREAFVPKLGKLPDFSLVNANALYRETLGPVTQQARRHRPSDRGGQRRPGQPAVLAVGDNRADRQSRLCPCRLADPSDGGNRDAIGPRLHGAAGRGQSRAAA